MAIVCFHKPGEENGWFSNWYLADFELDGVRYSSVEQCMMHRKALLFGDHTSADRIMRTTDPEKVKKLGREVANYSDAVWDGMRQIIVYRALLAKFGQNEELRDRLLATGTDTLAECARKDKVWGVGLAMDDPDRFHVALWRGRNLLGFTLMLVRDALRSDRR